MASLVEVRVDQVLHGYDRGHKELASSVQLDEESRATMLVYSDLLADLHEEADGSYLTCYPLPAASCQVLARTWQAGAGYRPGSVWTHSLLLDYRALALVADLVALEPLLIRSGEIERGRELKPLFVKDELTTARRLDFGPNAAIAIQGMYGRPDGQVAVPGRAPSANDILALALWRQMWPSLRREFTFVTGFGAGRPGAAGADWMLRFAKAPVHHVDLNGGLQVLLDDLSAPGQTPLRQFLSRYAVEASNPRRVAGPLAKLWAMPTAGFEDRLRAVRDLTLADPLPRLARDLVSAALDATAGPAALVTMVRELGDQPLEVDSSRVLQMAQELDASSFRSLVSTAAAAAADRLGGHVLEAVVRGAELDRLIEASDTIDRSTLVRLRPELLDAPRFWPSGDAARATLVRKFAGTLSMEKGWELFGSAIGTETVEAFLEGNPHPPAQVLLHLLSQASPQVSRLVATRLAASPGLIERLLEGSDGRTVVHLADAQIASGDPPSDPLAWCAVARRVRTGSADPAMLIVFYAAALRLGGDEALAAARQVYDPLMELARRYRLSREQERYLEATLPTKVSGWGLADRIMKAAVARWPPDGTSAGALTLSTRHEHSRDLVDEAIDRCGRSKLRQALLDSNLPLEVHRYLERRLETLPKKSWWL